MFVATSQVLLCKYDEQKTLSPQNIATLFNVFPRKSFEPVAHPLLFCPEEKTLVRGDVPAGKAVESRIYILRPAANPGIQNPSNELAFSTWLGLTNSTYTGKYLKGLYSTLKINVKYGILSPITIIFSLMKECLTIIKFKDRIFIMLSKNPKNLGFYQVTECRCWFTQRHWDFPNICGVDHNQMIFWGANFQQKFSPEKYDFYQYKKGFSWNK